MLETVIWNVSLLGSAALFYFIGVYAQKRQKPMWFWTGAEIDTSRITDIKQYNKDNGTMWKMYSLWFLGAGLAGIWNYMIGFIILILACTVGFALLIYTYKKIEKKYIIK